MDGALAARLIDTLGDEALLLLDPEGWIRWGSAAVLTVLGVSADELADRPLADLYPEDERALGLPARELREAQAHGRLVREGWTLRPDGSRFWALTTLTPLRDEAGMLTGFSRLVRDMDERVRVEETLRAAEARRVRDVAAVIDARPAEALSLSDLAGLAGLSRYHFIRAFRAATGETPRQYQIAARLRAAADRLVDTRAPITEIALDVGFNDISHFNATFRRAFGTSPRAWRRAA